MLQLYVETSETLRRFAANTTGATAIEYGLIASGIGVVIVPAMTLLGGDLAAVFKTIASHVCPAICLLDE